MVGAQPAERNLPTTALSRSGDRPPPFGFIAIRDLVRIYRMQALGVMVSIG